ncbi:MAG: AsmA family protein [Gammaproteobacteria bacterium]|nr:AsmA family protein [Gammaproteobacteria bacterium]MBV9619700.1 AsmA family protein [Gammaproteobacteria bacterium]
MRAAKIGLSVVAGILILFVLLLLAVRLFVNPNDYKARIVREVKSSTGRELALPGDIHLAVFPWIALELGPASLGNPAGFPDEPFAQVHRAKLRVRLLPLLRGQLEVGRVEIEGLDLRLRKNARGAGNWQFGGGGSEAPGPAGHGAAFSSLGGVSIKDSRLSFQALSAEQVNLVVGAVAPGRVTPVKFSLRLRTAPTSAPMALAGQFDLALATSASQYRFTDLKLQGGLARAASAQPIPWEFSAASADLDLNAGTLHAPAFAAQFGAARLQGGLEGTQLTESPAVQGRFALGDVSPRELMAQFGMSAPKSRDPRALTHLTASGEFSYGGQQLRARALDVRLDDSTLRGSAAVTNLETDALQADLTLDHIDLDRYRAAPAPAPKTPPPSSPTQLPSAGLRSLQLEGHFTVGSAHISGLNLTQLQVSVDAHNGIIHIAPASAHLYGGEYSGDVTLDDRASPPALRLEQSLKGVQLQPLLKDFAQSQRLSGRGTLTMTLTARGADTAALMRSLGGHVTANLDNGAVEGVDLWFEINRAVALVQQQALSGGQSSGRTRFDTFKASADLANGVATTKDLSIVSQNLRLAGQGTANLPAATLDYQVHATILKDPKSGKTLADIPLTITGPFARPEVRPDVAGLAKARVQQELEQHKGELQKQLQDKLKDLLK